MSHFKVVTNFMLLLKTYIQPMSVFLFFALEMIGCNDPALLIGISFPLHMTTLLPLWREAKTAKDLLDLISIKERISLAHQQP